ncbi:MAG: Dabb family protein [Verrucomicrobiota bacterium]
MVHLVVLCKLEEHVTPETTEEIIRAARSQLLKIPEAMQVRSGKRVDDENQWPLFYAVDCESRDKLESFLDDPIHVKFMEQVVKPNTWSQLELVYELEPGKDVNFS